MLIAWGAVLALMNVCFYVAIDRLALGTVAAIELLPVIGIVVLAQIPTRADAAGLLLVIAGVSLHREPRAPAAPEAPPTPRAAPTAAIPTPASPTARAAASRS